MGYDYSLSKTQVFSNSSIKVMQYETAFLKRLGNLCIQ